jgi:hypothetical protein
MSNEDLKAKRKAIVYKLLKTPAKLKPVAGPKPKKLGLTVAGKSKAQPAAPKKKAQSAKSTGKKK